VLLRADVSAIATLIDIGLNPRAYTQAGVRSVIRYAQSTRRPTRGDGVAEEGEGLLEARALAKVCWLFGAQFVSAKHISDGADNAAANDWSQNHHRGAAAYLAAYRTLVAG
jgi:hypothetical protein